MAFPGKAVLFVEGEITPCPRLPEPLNTIWQRHLVRSLGLIDIDRVVGINKKNLLVMEPAQVNKKKLSGVGMVGLDQRIAAELERDQFDVAVIAWDLLPPDPSGPTIACYSAAISSEPGSATGCRCGGIAGRWTKPVAATQFVASRRKPICCGGGDLGNCISA